MNKILVKLYVPTIEEEYDIWIPMNRRIYNVIKLVVRAINELTSGRYKPTHTPILYDKQNAKAYNINLSIRESNIRNGSELILI